MAIADVIKNSKGKWIGPSKLQLVWSPDNIQLFDCESTLEITFGEHEKYATLRYEWAQEGEPQFGEMLICGNTVAWSDSWHQSGEVMLLKGEGTTHVSVTGEYQWQDNPPWGWRIELSNPESDQLLLLMTNISPEGEEDWAVEANYHRIKH